MGLGTRRYQGLIRPAGIALAACVFLAACSRGPGESATGPRSQSASPSSRSTLTAGSPSPAASPATSPSSSAAVEPGDPTAALTGLAVAGIGEGGADLVMRIGADGFRIPDGEALFDVRGNRVLTAVPGRNGLSAHLIVRDLSGAVIRDIDTGMHLPQTGIVLGDDVYFGGINAGENGDDLDAAADAGAWVGRGDHAPEPVLTPLVGLSIYHAFERSPDGRSLAIWRCAVVCSTILLGPDGARAEVPKGVIALTNDVALTIGRFSDVTAYAIEDGRSLWSAETEGLYYGRYATSDGDGIVLSSIEPVLGGGASDQQLRVELLDALTGNVERSVVLPIDGPQPWVEARLSTDRYVAVLDVVLANPDDGADAIHVIDLEAGRLLDLDLAFGDVR